MVAGRGRAVRRLTAGVRRDQVGRVGAPTAGRGQSQVVPLGRQRGRSGRSAQAVPRSERRSAAARSGSAAVRTGKLTQSYSRTSWRQRQCYRAFYRRNRAAVEATPATVTASSWIAFIRFTFS